MSVCLVCEYIFLENDSKLMDNLVFSCRLYCTFHDEDYLYMCMDLAGGGELAKYIIAQKTLKISQGISDVACSEPVTQFYVAELVVALEYLHTNGIIHMDLKPESKNFYNSQINAFGLLVNFISIFILICMFLFLL